MINEKVIRRQLNRLWGLPVIVGIICIGMGVWALCSPTTSLPIFAYICAGLICLAGVLELTYAAFNTWPGSNWGWALALGIIDLICGVWMFTLPQPVLTVAFMFMMGIWLLFIAIDSVCESAMLSAYSPAWLIWMVLMLIATIIFAVIFLTNPILGGEAIWLWLGISLICFGAYRITLGFQLRSINRGLSRMV